MKIEDLSYEQKDELADALAANLMGFERDITELFRYLEQMTEIQLPDYWITEEGKATNPQEQRQEELSSELIEGVQDIEALRMKILMEIDKNAIQKYALEFDPILWKKFKVIIDSNDPYSFDNNYEKDDIAIALAKELIGLRRDPKDLFSILYSMTKVQFPEYWAIEVGEANNLIQQRQEVLIDQLMEHTQSIEQLRIKLLMEIRPEEVTNYDLAHGSYLWEDFKTLEVDQDGDNFDEFIQEILAG